MSLPATPDDFTVQLLNQHLARSANWEHGSFENITISIPHGALDGMSASVYQIDGELNAGVQMSLIAKLRDAGGSPQAVRGSHTEINFYRDIAPIAGVTTPNTYVAEFDSEKQLTLIVQEKLDSGTIGTIETYLPTADLTRIVLALAAMHAKWWNTDELANLDTARTFEEVFDAGAKLFKSGAYDFGRFMEQYGEHVHPDLIKYFQSGNQWLDSIRAGFSSNRTLCHYDVAAKNLSLPKDLSLPPVFFDWSLLARGSIGIELAVIVAYSLRIEEHHRIPEILDLYLEEMRSLGVTDLSRETLWNDVRYGLLVRLAAPVALTSRNHPPAHDLAPTILPRITSAVLETNAMELLKDV